MSFKQGHSKNHTPIYAQKSALFVLNAVQL